MEKISEHISFSEATYTSKKLPNIPSEKELEAMKLVALLCFEPMRKWYDKPLKVNSFFRSKEVNKAVGGASTSQHLFGEAIDLIWNSTSGELVEDCVTSTEITLFGRGDVTISAATGELAEYDKLNEVGKGFRNTLDTLLEDDHCKKAYKKFLVDSDNIY